MNGRFSCSILEVLVMIVKKPFAFKGKPAAHFKKHTILYVFEGMTFEVE